MRWGAAGGALVILCSFVKKGFLQRGRLLLARVDAL